MKVLVVDDEFPARGVLIDLLESFPDVQVVGECEDGDEVLEFLEHEAVDVVFLDIHMRVRDGLAVARDVLSLKQPPLVVFTTGFSEYGAQAFEVNAIDYVLKPYSQERLEQTIKKVTEVIQRQQAGVKNVVNSSGANLEKLPIWHEGRMILIPYQEVVFAKADGKRNTVIAARQKLFSTKYTLRDLEERLRAPRFLRTHKSYLVNMDKIREISPWFNNTYVLKLEHFEEYEIPVTRSYMKDFTQVLGL